MSKKPSPERLARRAAAKHAARVKTKAQHQEAERLRFVAQALMGRDRRGESHAALEIKRRCATSLAFRRVWSSLVVEHSRVAKAPGPEQFVSGSRPVQGGRMNPR
jgi:hypothetical protein